MTDWKLVILESPYAGEIEANVEYARAAVRDCVLRGESPNVSHLLFTQLGILRDEVPEERALGIAAGLAWKRVADYSVFYTDRGWSRGMLNALDKIIDECRNQVLSVVLFDLLLRAKVSIRSLEDTPLLPTVCHVAVADALVKCLSGAR